jgi:hypothetical protein
MAIANLQYKISIMPNFNANKNSLVLPGESTGETGTRSEGVKILEISIFAQ